MNIYHCEYAFDPCFEVLDKKKILQTIISTNKRGKGSFYGTELLTIIIQLSNIRIIWV